MKYFEHESLGFGKPHLAVIACTHGDEIIGKKTLTNLKKIKIEHGTLHFIIAHSLALKKNKRFIKKDLNRSFPGNPQGVLEEKIAHQLTPLLKSMDLVIDIHGTNSGFNFLAIVVKLNKKNRQVLKCLADKKIALIKTKSLTGKPLISICPNSISLEYGPNKLGKNYLRALRDVKLILKKFKFIQNKKNKIQIYQKKELFTVTGNYPVPAIFRQNKKLRDFHLIQKGDFIGSTGKNKLYSNKNFYPIFLGKGRYKKLLALIANKKIVRL